MKFQLEKCFKMVFQQVLRWTTEAHDYKKTKTMFTVEKEYNNKFFHHRSPNRK